MSTHEWIGVGCPHLGGEISIIQQRRVQINYQLSSDSIPIVNIELLTDRQHLNQLFDKFIAEHCRIEGDLSAITITTSL